MHPHRHDPWYRVAAVAVAMTAGWVSVASAQPAAAPPNASPAPGGAAANRPPAVDIPWVIAGPLLVFGVIGVVVTFKVARKLLYPGDDGSGQFTAEDFRKMRDSGQITQQEYTRAIQAIADMHSHRGPGS